jgi:hypothetical protein
VGLFDRFKRMPEQREGYPLTLDQLFSFAGMNYPLTGMQQTLSGKEEKIGADFAGLISGAYRANGVVWACALARLSLFSEARHQFRQIRNGTPGDLFGTKELAILEHPLGPTSTTGDLLASAEVDVTGAGNAFGVRRAGPTIRRLRPDWVDLIIGSESDSSVQIGDVDAEVIGLKFYPGGRGSKRDPEFFVQGEFFQYAPYPDPLAPFRGMSWLTPVIREIQADSGMTSHKDSYLSKGATPNMIVKLDVKADDFERFVKMFEEKHTGAANAYKTLFLAAGADATVVGNNFREMSFKETQGSGETRIAAASGIHPVIVGLSEGLQGSSLNAGNFNSARRLTADKTLRPLWRNWCGSVSSIINVPSGSELWVDLADVAFLREDEKDAAEIQSVQAQSIKALVEAGYVPETVVDAVISGDFKRLKHSQLFSVQLQPPGTELPSNGNGKPAALALPGA